MDKKEKEVQKALGLFKIYEGYTKVLGTTYYEVYEVEDITLAGAEQQINIMIEHKKSLSLRFIREKNAFYNNAYYTIKRHKCK